MNQQTPLLIAYLIELASFGMIKGPYSGTTTPFLSFSYFFACSSAFFSFCFLLLCKITGAIMAIDPRLMTRKNSDKYLSNDGTVIAISYSSGVPK
jgi:hypothetical protein